MKTYTRDGKEFFSVVAFLFFLFARCNPALSPRRKRRTAAAHARVAAELGRWINTTPATAVQRWAALTVLEAGTYIPMPPGNYRSIGAGSLRSHATDQGGVEGTTLLKLAEWVINPHDSAGPAPLMLRAWQIAYPATARLDMSGAAWNEDCREAVFNERVEQALAEWELVEDPEAIFWWQIDAPPEDAAQLWELFGAGKDMPEPEASAEYEGAHYSLSAAYRGSEGDLSLQFQTEEDGRDAFRCALRLCEPTWTLQVNRTAWLHGARQFMGTVEEFQQ